MLAFKHILLRAIFLFSFITSGIAQREEEEEKKEYDPTENRRPENVTGLGELYSWVGSYYNATVEAEFVLDFTAWTKPSEQCEKLRNFSTIVKYDAILSVVEHQSINPGNNSLQFWLTLTPQGSDPTNWNWMNDGENRSYVWSARPYDTPNDYYYLFQNEYKYKGPDYFNFTTTQVSGGAYNITSPSEPLQIANWQNMKMPVCNSTEYKDEWRISILERGYYYTLNGGWAGPVDYHHPKTSLQFDDKTANLTFDAFWNADAIEQPNFNEVVDEPWWPTWRNRNLVGHVSFNFSGVLDEYHSDILSLDNPLPVWQRTVGFGNNSANIGYGDTPARMDESPDNVGERIIARVGLALIAVIVSIVVLL